MDESLLPKLTKCTQDVVRKASKPGGLLEKDEFTMAVARKLITEAMGLEEGALDGKEWKKVVKEQVTTALAEPEPPQSKSKSKPDSEVKKAKPESKPKNKPESSSKPKENDKVSGESKSKNDNDASVDAGDESDMSSVYDAPPKRKKKDTVTGKDNEKEKKEKRPKKDVDDGLSPDEAKVAELKRIVVACGARKQWSKEFADYPTASSQIRQLNSILSDLGMKGTPTIGKAKSIKEKRELAAELDAVQEFEAERGVKDAETEERASRSKDSGKRRSGDISEDDEDEDNVRAKPKSALASVLDFLGDQSDSD